MNLALSMKHRRGCSRAEKLPELFVMGWQMKARKKSIPLLVVSVLFCRSTEMGPDMPIFAGPNEMLIFRVKRLDKTRILPFFCFFRNFPGKRGPDFGEEVLRDGPYWSSSRPFF